jgi:protein-S-isoprenylcysteine O-methyltransferase Ste14
VVIANAPPVVVLPPVLLGILHFDAVLREEHYLECKFGDAHLSYKQDVSRWP